MRVDERWARFEDPDLQRLHDEVLDLRHRLFAHNDATPYREVVVVAPDSAEEERIVFSKRSIVGMQRVCYAQSERMSGRITEIVQLLRFSETWRDGARIPLRDVSAKGQIERPSPFQPPSSPRTRGD